MLLSALFPGSFAWLPAGSLNFFSFVFVKLILSVMVEKKKWFHGKKGVHKNEMLPLATII